MNPASAPALDVDTALLRGWPLPQPDPEGDKETRGRALVIAGSPEMPGAALLASIAALRAGAGRLTVATAARIAPGLALALPEGRVIALPDTPEGGLRADGVGTLERVLKKTQAVLLGPGLQDEAATKSFVQAMLARCGEAAVVLDALAMNVVDVVPRFERPVLLTPHAGEMARLTGAGKATILQDGERACREAAQRWNAVVALKGARTWIATPQGQTWHHDGGSVGLATSGSGDVLAGLVAGLAARGAPLAQACVWGVALHARAGLALATQRGPLGFLARELPGEVPRLMAELGAIDNP
jgi:hydroxyethylthiazole kinase-like uncharacterized protein yjeF